MAYTFYTLQANSGNYGASRTASKIKYIVVHYTGNKTDTAKNNATYFKNNVVKASSHYFVDDTTVYQSVPDLKVAWAVGGSKYSDCSTTGGGTMYGTITNTNSISVEMCSTSGAITDATITNAVTLIKSLMDKYNISKSNVYRHFDVNGKHCLPLDCTELLTKNGWVSLENISIGDIVAQYVPEDDSIEFAKVLDKVEPYDSEVLVNRRVEATSGHRMYLKPNCKSSKEFRDVEWGNALDGHKQYIIKNGAVYKGAGLNLTDDELRFLVWVQGDGHYMKDGNCRYGIEFHLKKQRKIASLSGLLDSLAYPYTISNKCDGSESIRIYGKKYVDWCETWLENKEFDWNMLEMSKEQYDIFWNELLIVDGCKSGELYASSKEKNLDVVQAVCATKGVRTCKSKLGSKIYDYSAIVKANSNYTVGYNDITSKRITSVSCVTVPSGYILIRQGQKTFIVGNCPGWSGWYGTSSSKWTSFKSKLSSSTSTSTSSSSSVSTTSSSSSSSSSSSTTTSSSSSTITVDGSWGKNTTKKAQKVFGTTVDGIVSSQSSSYKKYLTAASTTSWKFVSSAKGSQLIKALQKKVGVTQDGIMGPKSVKALQKFVGTTQDGYMGTKTVTAFQKWLNKQ